MDLCHEGIFQGQVITAVDEQLVLEMLRRVEVLTGRLLPVTPTLHTKPNSQIQSGKENKG